MYLSMAELADRWRCAQSTARRTLRVNGAEVFDMAIGNRKGKKLVLLRTVEQIEIRRTKRLK